MSFLSRAFRGAAPVEARDITSSNFVPSPLEDGYQSAPLLPTVLGGNGAMAQGAFYACVTLLADTLASLSVSGYRDVGEARVKLSPQPKLLTDSPYPGVTWFEWLWMLGESLAVTGNAFCYVTARGPDLRPTALMPVHPDFVSVRWETPPFGPQWPELVYRIGGERVATEDVVHIKRYPIAGQPLGMSPIQKAASAVGLALAAERYGLQYFRDSANPSSVLESDLPLDDESTRRIQQQWIATHGGKRRPAILSGGIKWRPIAISPNESQFLECVVAGTLVSMADGSRVPVEDLRVGDRVMAWNGSKLEAAPVAAVGWPPVKPLVKITTARGRELTCTTDHPILGLTRLRTPGCRPLPTNGHWIKAGDLQPGHYVRVGLGDVSESGNLSPKIAYFLGAMVGDGYISTNRLTWSSEEPAVVDRMGAAVESLGGRLQYKDRCDYNVKTGGLGRGGSPIRGILNESGLVGTHSHDKFVPDMINSGGPSAWRAFLAAYFDADGSIRDRAGKQKPAAYWSSTSKELLGGCQHLLAMLGINSAIYPMGQGGKKRILGMDSEARPSWGLYVMGNSELSKLADELDLAHPEKRRRLGDYRGAESRYRAVNFEYDAVKTVEYLGEGETVGVEIEGLHTYVTNGIISHNTRAFQRSEIAMWFRIPPHMIGDTAKSTSWGTGIEQQSIGYVTYTLRPWLTCIEQILTALLPRGQFARFNIDGLLRGDAKTRWEAYRLGRDTGVYSVNDIRALENLPPVENGGDLRLQPMNFVPLGTDPGEAAEPMAEPDDNDADEQPTEPADDGAAVEDDTEEE